MGEASPADDLRFMMSKIGLLIIDEYAAVRDALTVRFRASSRIEVLATTGRFSEGLRLSRQLHPDVILMEIKGRQRRGPAMIAEMVEAVADRPAGIIVLTSYADKGERQTALRHGASRYLLKQIDSGKLLSEIEEVAQEVAANNARLTPSPV